MHRCDVKSFNYSIRMHFISLTINRMEMPESKGIKRDQCTRLGKLHYLSVCGKSRSPSTRVQLLTDPTVNLSTNVVKLSTRVRARYITQASSGKQLCGISLGSSIRRIFQREHTEKKKYISNTSHCDRTQRALYIYL